MVRVWGLRRVLRGLQQAGEVPWLFFLGQGTLV